MAPLFRYACAFGASCVLFHVAETCVKARSWRNAAGDLLLVRSEASVLAVRDVKFLEDVEGAMERNWVVREGARRARREQRAIAGGQAAGELELRKCPAIVGRGVRLAATRHSGSRSAIEDC